MHYKLLNNEINFMLSTYGSIQFHFDMHIFVNRRDWCFRCTATDIEANKSSTFTESYNFSCNVHKGHHTNDEAFLIKTSLIL